MSIAETLRIRRLEAYKRNQSAIAELPDSYRYLSLTLPSASFLESAENPFRKSLSGNATFWPLPCDVHCSRPGEAAKIKM